MHQQKLRYKVEKALGVNNNLNKEMLGEQQLQMLIQLLRKQMEVDGDQSPNNKFNLKMLLLQMVGDIY
jgi:hypothetical protein